MVLWLSSDILDSNRLIHNNNKSRRYCLCFGYSILEYKHNIHTFILINQLDEKLICHDTKNERSQSY